MAGFRYLSSKYHTIIVGTGSGRDLNYIIGDEFYAKGRY